MAFWKTGNNWFIYSKKQKITTCQTTHIWYNTKRKKFVHNNNEEREVKNMDFFKTLKKAEWLNLLLSLVFIIIGAILVKDPEGVLKTVSLIAGIVF